MFTEHGAIMAAMALNSPRAIQMSVYVARAFVKLRETLVSNTALARRVDVLKRSIAALDAEIRQHFEQAYEAILGLMGTSTRKSRDLHLSHACFTSRHPARSTSSFRRRSFSRSPSRAE